MVEKKLVALGLICAILFVSVFGAVIVLNQKDLELQTITNQISGLENEKNTLESQVTTLQTNVSSLQSDVVSLNTDRIALESQLSSLQSEATSLAIDKVVLESQVLSLQAKTTTLENEKSTLESIVSTLQTLVSSLQSQVSVLENGTLSLEAQILNLQSELTALESEVIQSFELGYAEGTSDGYQLGYEEGYTQGVEDGAGTGWYIRDPTYSEVIAFVNSDTTDENEYTEDYICFDFTSDFKSNAFQTGYRCGFVYIELNESAHAIVCFNTTDNGLIYIEPQTDEIVTLTIGQVYDDQTSWGPITYIGIIW